MSIKTKVAIAKPFDGKPKINIPSIIGYCNDEILATNQDCAFNTSKLVSRVKEENRYFDILEIPPHTAKIIKSTTKISFE